MWEDRAWKWGGAWFHSLRPWVVCTEEGSWGCMPPFLSALDCGCDGTSWFTVPDVLGTLGCKLELSAKTSSFSTNVIFVKVSFHGNRSEARTQASHMLDKLSTNWDISSASNILYNKKVYGCRWLWPMAAMIPCSLSLIHLLTYLKQAMWSKLIYTSTKDLFFLYLFVLYVCMFYLHVCLRIHVCVLRGQKNMSDPLGLELQ